MITPELITYIRNTQSQGHSDEDIKKALADEGWSEADLLDAFKQVGSGSGPAIKPQKKDEVQGPTFSDEVNKQSETSMTNDTNNVSLANTPTLDEMQKKIDEDGSNKKAEQRPSVPPSDSTYIPPPIKEKDSVKVTASNPTAAIDPSKPISEIEPAMKSMMSSVDQKKIVGLVILIVVVILMAGTTAAYFVFGKKPKVDTSALLFDAISSSVNADSFDYEASVDVGSSNYDFSLDVKGSSIKNDGGNPSGSADFSLSLKDLSNQGTFDFNLDLNLIMKGNELFFRVEKIPLFLSAFADLDSLENQWIKLSTSEIPELFGGEAIINSTEGSASDDLQRKILRLYVKAYRNNPILDLTLAGRRDPYNSDTAYNLKFTIDKANVGPFMEEILNSEEYAEISGLGLEYEESITVEPFYDESVLSILDSVSGNILIGKIDNELRKIIIKFDPNKLPSELKSSISEGSKFMMDVGYSNYNGRSTIQAPSDTITFEKALEIFESTRSFPPVPIVNN